MKKSSATRDELERRLRDLVPTSPLSLNDRDPKSAAAAAGASGLLAGYVWGWFRGRRSKKRS